MLWKPPLYLPLLGVLLYPALAWQAPLELNGPLPFPHFLQVWNKTFSPREVSQSLHQDATPEWLAWYRLSQGKERLHQTRVEFLGDQQFLVQTPGEMTLVNTSRMDENVLLLNRRSLRFDDQESLDLVAQRIQKTSTRDIRGVAPLLFLIDYNRGRTLCRTLAQSGTNQPEGPRPLRRGIASLSETSSPELRTKRTSSHCRASVQNGAAEIHQKNDSPLTGVK